MRERGTLHLLLGPVGAGKSTWARRRAVGGRALFLDLDTWMVRLYGADPRPAEGVLAWYMERRARCQALLWDTAREALDCGAEVLIEPGLVRRAERQAFVERAWADDVDLVVHLFDASREERRRRVLARNEAAGAQTQVVPLPMFELASDAWEALDAAERAQLQPQEH